MVYEEASVVVRTCRGLRRSAPLHSWSGQPWNVNEALQTSPWPRCLAAAFRRRTAGPADTNQPHVSTSSSFTSVYFLHSLQNEAFGDNSQRRYYRRNHTCKKVFFTFFILVTFFMAALCNRGAIIFLPCSFFPSFFYLFSSPNLSGRRSDVCHTSTHGVALVRI